MDLSRDQLVVSTLIKNQAENETVELKDSLADPTEIGKRISALANSARLHNHESGFLLWGIDDETREPITTKFDPTKAKIGNQPLDIWLASALKPNVHFGFKKVEMDNNIHILLEIPAANNAPVEFKGDAYIRVGEATTLLSNHSAKLMELVSKIGQVRWETAIAADLLKSDEVLSMLDHHALYRLLGETYPTNQTAILNKLCQEKLINVDVDERWKITNMGAILLATDLKQFDIPVSGRAIRFVKYAAKHRASETLFSFESNVGYATGFETLFDTVRANIPRTERIEGALRRSTGLFPELSVRELLANALVHQDMTQRGRAPLIELFPDRIEVSNPGEPLMETSRMIDVNPQSRNEMLANLMRRMGVCEQLGTGIDKIVLEAEKYHLTPPEFRAEGGATKVILGGPKKHGDMTGAERVRACFQHTAIMWLQKDRMRNKTLCERFGIMPGSEAQATAVINAAKAQGLIKLAEEGNPRAGYIPFWA